MTQLTSRLGIACCGICKKQLGRRDKTARSQSGQICHTRCLPSSKPKTAQPQPKKPKPPRAKDGTIQPDARTQQKLKQSGGKKLPESLQVAKFDTPARPPAARREIRSPFRTAAVAPPPECPVCEEPILDSDPRAETADGWAHAHCADDEGPRVPVSRAERSFARNKEKIESGAAFAGHKASTYKLGSSPSSTSPAR